MLRKVTDFKSKTSIYLSHNDNYELLKDIFNNSVTLMLYLDMYQNKDNIYFGKTADRLIDGLTYKYHGKLALTNLGSRVLRITYMLYCHITNETRKVINPYFPGDTKNKAGLDMEFLVNTKISEILHRLSDNDLNKLGLKSKKDLPKNINLQFIQGESFVVIDTELGDLPEIVATTLSTYNNNIMNSDYDITLMNVQRCALGITYNANRLCSNSYIRIAANITFVLAVNAFSEKKVNGFKYKNTPKTYKFINIYKFGGNYSKITNIDSDYMSYPLNNNINYLRKEVA